MKKQKSCGKCGISQSLLDDFYKDVTNPTGRYSYCKKCSNKPRAKKVVDIARTKEIQAIMAVGIDPRKTQLFYMRREVPLETKQVRIR